MEVNKTVIGENAGKVWRTLENRRLSWDELVRSTGLEPAELAMAVGWLRGGERTGKKLSG